MTLRRFFAPFFFRFAPLPLLALTAGCGAEEENPWNGTTYLLDIQSQDWSEPRGIGSEIDAFVPSFLLRVDGDAPDAFDVTIGTADAAGEQDTCNPTNAFGATASPPAMTLGPTQYSLFIQHTDEPVAVEGTIYDLTIKDVLPDGDTPSSVGEFSATMDFRELYPLFTLIVDPTPDKVCTLLEDSYSSACAPCPNDDEPYCLTVKAIGLGATPWSGAMEPVDAIDPSCFPTTPAP
jgi:hypothetical protein